MARWKLMAPHYLKTEGVTWEYSETNRTTGRPVRKSFDVPIYLNPHDAGDWTHKWGSRDNEDGYIGVKQGEGDALDLVFLGDPTPDMMPLDEEAAAISAKFEPVWKYKPENSFGFSQTLIDQFQSEMTAVATKPTEVTGMSELITVMIAQAAQTGKLIEALAPARRA